MDEPFPAQMMPDIERFFESEHTREPGLDLYPDVFDAGLFFPLQRPEELRKMIQIARTRNPQVIYEIGADKGGGLYHWCKCFPDVKRVIACEIRGTPYRYLFEKAFPHIDFLWLEASSYDPDTVSTIDKWLGKDLIDILFIDGDKSWFDKDFDTMQPYMKHNGIVFMHDIQDRPPVEAFESVIKRGYLSERVIDKSDTHASLERQKAGIPPSSLHEGWLRHWKGASCGVGVIYLD